MAVLPTLDVKSAPGSWAAVFLAILVGCGIVTLLILPIASVALDEVRTREDKINTLSALTVHQETSITEIQREINEIRTILASMGPTTVGQTALVSFVTSTSQPTPQQVVSSISLHHPTNSMSIYTVQLFDVLWNPLTATATVAGTAVSFPYVLTPSETMIITPEVTSDAPLLIQFSHTDVAANWYGAELTLVRPSGSTVRIASSGDRRNGNFAFALAPVSLVAS